MKDFLNHYLKNVYGCNLETGDFPGPVVTISRQTGCSAQRIAIKLSKILTGYSYMSDTKTDAEWRWVDKEVFRNAVEEMKEDLAQRGSEHKQEILDHLNAVAKAFSQEKVYDIHDDQLIETLKSIICKLASHGRYIIVGRSAGVILKDIPNKLSIRLEAPLEWRINRVMQLRNITHKKAEDYVVATDQQRDSFIEKVNGRKPENSDFDVIFNYATLLDDQIIDAIVNLLKHKKIINHEDAW